MHTRFPAPFPHRPRTARASRSATRCAGQRESGKKRPGADGPAAPGHALAHPRSRERAHRTGDSCPSGLSFEKERTELGSWGPVSPRFGAPTGLEECPHELERGLRVCGSAYCIDGQGRFRLGRARWESWPLPSFVRALILGRVRCGCCMEGVIEWMCKPENFGL